MNPLKNCLYGMETQHVIKDGKRTSKRNWDIHQKGSITKDKGKELALTRKRKVCFSDLWVNKTTIQNKTDLSCRERLAVSYSSISYWFCIRTRTLGLDIKVWGEGRESLEETFWRLRETSRKLTGNAKRLAKVRRQVFVINSISRNFANF